MNEFIRDGIGKNERILVKLTEKQAQFLDHLLWKESNYKKKRGILWIDEVYQEHGCTDYDDFVSRLKESIVNQAGIMLSDDELEDMEKIQRQG
tara:strand:+ start:209 stop:487 length:279 start_codon:yes stop_codon:yes gene_type:complete